MEVRRKINDELPQLISDRFDPFGSPPKSGVALDANGSTCMMIDDVLGIQTYLVYKGRGLIYSLPIGFLSVRTMNRGGGGREKRGGEKDGGEFVLAVASHLHHLLSAPSHSIPNCFPQRHH